MFVVGVLCWFGKTERISLLFSYLFRSSSASPVVRRLVSYAFVVVEIYHCECPALKTAPSVMTAASRDA